LNDQIFTDEAMGRDLRMLDTLAEAQDALAEKLNRHSRRSMKKHYRTDGLPKVGYSWADCYTRNHAYKIVRRVKLQREKAARRITRLAA
jgi:hypothetical protein